MSDDEPGLTADDVEAAASVGRLPALVRQLVLDGAWASLDVVLRYARDNALPLAEIEDTVRAVKDGVAALPEVRAIAAAPELRALQRQAAYLIIRRLERDPLTHTERNALGVAANILAALGDLERAARIFERAADDVRAAEAYGALGDLDRMESCLGHEEQRRLRHGRVADVLRQFDTLAAGGDRVAALAATAGLVPDDFEASGLLSRARDIEARLCRGRAVSLATPSGEVVRFAGTPAVLGRDGLCEVPLRDPGVSRRHALVTALPGGFAVEDVGSRAGTRLVFMPARGRAEVVRGPLPLHDEGELVLGEHCTLSFRTLHGALALSGAAGVDRALRAHVGPTAVALATGIAGAEGLIVRFDGSAVRIARDAAVAVRVDDRLIGAGCDLLHGDVIEIGDAHLRLEVL